MNIILPKKGAKCIGSKEKPAIKVLPIQEFKATKNNGIVTISGYANTKGHPDRYGDVPTVFTELRNYIYELTQFRKNPVMLIDHENSAMKIAGSFKELVEDEMGLRFSAEFSKSTYPPIAHVRQVYEEGHGKALSIAGRFYYEDKDNFDHLTYADIFEISLVGVGADPDALGFGDGGKAVIDGAARDAEAAESLRKRSEESLRKIACMLGSFAQPSETEAKLLLDEINGLLPAKEA